MSSSRPRASRRVELPLVEPIIPVERPTAWNDPDWLFEPKHDGFRGLVYITPDGCTIRSKRGHTFKKFGALAGPLCEVIAARTAILDGEVLAVDSKGLPDFMGLLRGTGRLVYAAFDLLWLDGRDLRGVRLTRRKRHLESVLPYESSEVFRTIVVEEHGFVLFDPSSGWGIVAKRKADPYGPAASFGRLPGGRRSVVGADGYRLVHSLSTPPRRIGRRPLGRHRLPPLQCPRLV